MSATRKLVGAFGSLKVARRSTPIEQVATEADTPLFPVTVTPLTSPFALTSTERLSEPAIVGADSRPVR